MLLVVFLMMVIVTGVRWNLSIVLICISLWPEMVSIFSCVLKRMKDWRKIEEMNQFVL
jgi:hypothetical protein